MRQITYIEHIAYIERSVYNEPIRKEERGIREMDKFWSLALLFFLIWCITTDIIYIIIRFIKLIACRNKGDCKNRKCLVNETCMKYNKSLTQEEYDYLMKLLDDTFKEERTLKE